MHPCVYYADSKTAQAIQAADLVAGIRRRAAERDSNLQAIDDSLAGIGPAALVGKVTHSGRRWTGQITLF